MTTEIEKCMHIMLSARPADVRWGPKAILSINDQGVTIHQSITQSITSTDMQAIEIALHTIARAARKINVQGIKQVALVGDGWGLEQIWAFWQGFYDPKDKEGGIKWPILSDKAQQEFNLRLQTVSWVRKIINTSAESLGPEQLAQAAAALIIKITAQKSTQKNEDTHKEPPPCKYVTYNIIQGEALRQKKYMGIYTVGRGSARAPALLELDYNPSGKADASVYACLVGKGITFDSGGYSLKPSTGMDTMKSDMGGAAIITGALALAIGRGLKKRVKLYLCCADNMVSGNAFKLGDIIEYRNGKTVEVMNTDAEGRLVLADGLIDAAQQNPLLLIDAATLTGAAKIAVGSHYHALFSFDNNLAKSLLQSASAEHEPFWRLPLSEFHRHQLPSNFADLNNISSSPNTAGASTAAAFLSHFVKNYQKGWLHIDCSANYYKCSDNQWAPGATGLGVRSIANLLLAKAVV